MNLISAEEFFEHKQCNHWMLLDDERSRIVDEYVANGCDMGIQRYIKIMHPEVYVAWRLTR